jgi:septal ring-binding cell division protein DamX
MADEGFHEIQLNGKQLVFLFMALTVFSVVVFLCGVMVGRGVQAPRVQLAAASVDATADPTLTVERPSPVAAVTGDRAPVSTQESLTYAERLEAPVTAEPIDEPLAPAAERVAPPVEAPPPAASAATRPARPAQARQSEPAAPPPGDTPGPALAEPPGNGFVVQVGAYPRGTADTIAKGLIAKGFPSFVTPRERGLYAVRVGKYPDRRQAEAVARRLEQNEQFNKPWVTR